MQEALSYFLAADGARYLAWQTGPENPYVKNYRGQLVEMFSEDETVLSVVGQMQLPKRPFVVAVRKGKTVWLRRIQDVPEDYRELRNYCERLDNHPKWQPGLELRRVAAADLERVGAALKHGHAVPAEFGLEALRARISRELLRFARTGFRRPSGE